MEKRLRDATLAKRIFENLYKKQGGVELYLSHVAQTLETEEDLARIYLALPGSSISTVFPEGS